MGFFEVDVRQRVGWSLVSEQDSTAPSNVVSKEPAKSASSTVSKDTLGGSVMSFLNSPLVTVFFISLTAATFE